MTPKKEILRHQYNAPATSVRISTPLVDKVKRVALANDVTMRTQFEQLIEAGMLELRVEVGS